MTQLTCGSANDTKGEGFVVSTSCLKSGEVGGLGWVGARLLELMNIHHGGAPAKSYALHELA